MKIAAVALLICLVACTGTPMKKPLTPTNLTEYVTQACGTEPAFDNAYWNEHRAGIYVDINTNEPLFSSIDKFDSGTGWPSFTKPLSTAQIQEKEDASLGTIRTEVRTNASHLGHVFDDGPNGSQRFCINSAALKFIPYQDLDKNNLGQYKQLFHFETATFAGGCFWGVQHLLENLTGVISTRAGYTGGAMENPTYEDVSSGDTGHAEAVEIIFDPKQITYEELLDYFWRLHDPTGVNQQGPDVGTQYRSAIFYHSEQQRIIAEASKKAFDAKKIFDKPAATQIVPAGPFYAAEDYHQFYFDKHPGLVCHTLRDQ